VQGLDLDPPVEDHPHGRLELVVEVGEGRRERDLLHDPHERGDRRVGVGDPDQAQLTTAARQVDAGLDGLGQPDALVHDVGTQAGGPLTDQLGGLLPRCDDEVGTQLPGQILAGGVGLHHHDCAGATGTDPLRGHEPDRPGALHDGDVTQPQAASAHGVEGDRGRLDLGGQLVAQAGHRRHHAVGGDRQARGEAAVAGRQRVAPRGREERGEAAVGVTGPARVAAPAGRGDGHHDAIALRQRTDAVARRRHRAGPLVPADRRVVRATGPVSVDVGAADAAERDVDDDAARGRLRVGELEQLDAALPRDQRCQHRATPSPRRRDTMPC
jgi:hypothetical protein